MLEGNGFGWYTTNDRTYLPKNFSEVDIMSRHETAPSEYAIGGERFLTDEMNTIIASVAAELGNESVSQSLHFSTGVINRLQRQMTLGCSLVSDTRLILPMLDRNACSKLPVRLECFIDDPRVVSLATQKRVTRAEIAAERALALPGSKILLIGSAPMALSRILQAHKQVPLVETTVVAAVSGFANVVDLKERLWDSGLPCIVVRGRAGGPPAAIAIANALMKMFSPKSDN